MSSLEKILFLHRMDERLPGKRISPESASKILTTKKNQTPDEMFRALKKAKVREHLKGT